MNQEPSVEATATQSPVSSSEVLGTVFDLVRFLRDERDLCTALDIVKHKYVGARWTADDEWAVGVLIARAALDTRDLSEVATEKDSS